MAWKVEVSTPIVVMKVQSLWFEYRRVQGVPRRGLGRRAFCPRYCWQVCWLSTNHAWSSLEPMIKTAAVSSWPLSHSQLWATAAMPGCGGGDHPCWATYVVPPEHCIKIILIIIMISYGNPWLMSQTISWLLLSGTLLQQIWLGLGLWIVTQCAQQVLFKMFPVFPCILNVSPINPAMRSQCVQYVIAGHILILITNHIKVTLLGSFRMWTIFNWWAHCDSITGYILIVHQNFPSDYIKFTLLNTF